MTERKVRSRRLLDALAKIPQRPYVGKVWRSVREGRDPLACWHAGGRWDDRTFDVLYTSETRDAAIAERRYHLHQGQPIPPLKIHFELFELRISLQAVMVLDRLESLAAVGLDTKIYGQLAYSERIREYPNSQQIAEACFFLGADGIVVPSARELQSRNVIVFCDQDTEIRKEVAKNHGTVDLRLI